MASTKQSSGTSVLKEVVTLGLDLAKTTVYFVGLDATGQVLTRRQYSKAKLPEVTEKMGPCRIGVEACCGSHHLGRQLLAQGHDVKLMPPKYVKPFVKRDNQPSFGSATAGNQSYQAGTAISPLTLPAASGGDGSLTYRLAPGVPGLSFTTDFHGMNRA